MSTDIRPRIRLPRSARPGDTVVIRTMVTHAMETGHRRDAGGALKPRRTLRRFTCRFNDRMVIDMDLETAISANPYIEFAAVIDGPGEFVFAWQEDDGTVHEHRQALNVG